QELEVVDVEPDPEDPLELSPEPARLVRDRVVGVDLREPAHRLLDPVGQPAHHAHAVARHGAHLALEAPDEDDLDREEHHAHARHPRVRVHHEPERPDQHGAVKGGSGQRQPEVPTEVLHLAQDHRHELPGRRVLQVGQREPQDPVVQLAPEVPEHGLRDVAFKVLLHVLESSVHEDSSQEPAAEPEEGVEVPPPDRLVDDALLEIEHERIQPEPENEADRDQNDLRLVAPLDDVAVEVPVYVRRPYAYGSAASRSPSPRKLKARTVSTTMTTGVRSQG